MDCCGLIQTPLEVQDLVMQRIPTPRIDPLQSGNFLCRDQALLRIDRNPNALTDLTDLPSMKVDTTKEDAKQRVRRDKVM